MYTSTTTEYIVLAQFTNKLHMQSFETLESAKIYYRTCKKYCSDVTIQQKNYNYITNFINKGGI